MNISCRHSNSNFAHSFDLHCLMICEKYICRRWFLLCELWWRLSIYTLKNNNMVSKIWVGMSTTTIHWLQFKIQSHLQKRRLWMRVHHSLIPKKNSLKFLTLHSPFCLFLIQILLLNCHPEYFGVYFSWWNHQMCFRMVHSNTKNAKSRVRQSQVCYLRTPHSSALKVEGYSNKRRAYSMFYLKIIIF